MRQLILPATCLALAACGASDNAPVQAQGPCAGVQQVQAARAEAEPFASLRGDQFMLGENPLPDKWVARDPAFGEACEISVMDGFFGEDSNIYTYKCQLFEAGTFDREENELKARAIMAEVEDTLKTCLGDAWTFEEKTEDLNADIYRKVKFEPKSGTPEINGFRADPVYIQLQFASSPRTRGGVWEIGRAHV